MGRKGAPQVTSKPEGNGERRRGEIIELNLDRGYGFLVDGEGVRRFFHAVACDGISIEDLIVGNGVSFLPEYSPKGPRALVVRREEAGGR